jgi:hypothetical protein
MQFRRPQCLRSTTSHQKVPAKNSFYPEIYFENRSISQNKFPKRWGKPAGLPRHPSKDVATFSEICFEKHYKPRSSYENQPGTTSPI